MKLTPGKSGVESPPRADDRPTPSPWLTEVPDGYTGIDSQWE